MLQDCKVGAIVFFVRVLERTSISTATPWACRCRRWTGTTARSPSPSSAR